MRRAKNRIFTAIELAQAVSGADRASVLFGFDYMEHWTLVAQWTDTTTAAGTFTANSPADNLTKTAHGLVAEATVQVSSTTTLPAPLAAATIYFVIFVDVNNFQLATTRALAQAGTQIDITDNGTGTHTVTPETPLNASLKVQYANTGDVDTLPEEGDWVDSGQAIAMDDSPLIGTLSQSDVGARRLRVVLVPTAGQGALTVDLSGKGVG